MKTTREELIDFLKWFEDNYDWEEIDVTVDNYFKYLDSINSASNESLSVTENEAKEKDFSHYIIAHSNYKNYFKYEYCPMCGDKL